MRARPVLRLRSRVTVASAAALLLAGAGCSDAPTTTSPPPTAVAEQPRPGGTLVLGAAQEPGCADWFASCGNSAWGVDMMGTQTLPRAFNFVDGQYRPSPLLAGEPSMVAGPPQTVTYRIDPRAVWSDGTPITSSDFKYTAEQARSRGETAAVAVDSVDDSDPRTAVVTFKSPTPGWRDNFRLIVPKHLLDGKDRTAVMGNGYSFSGGPWRIESWTKGQEIRLVPNPTYWGPKPFLHAVVFKVITDAAAYQAAYKTGQLDMAFVQGAQPEVAELRDVADTDFQANVGLTHEFVMFNTAKPPLDSRAVRQALAYAADRESIVTQLSGPLKPDIKPAQAYMSPGNTQWYSEPFGRYRRDTAKVAQLMTGDGWAKGSDGVWAKAGTRAAVELSTVSGNRRRELTQQILQSQWKDAGFDVSVRNATAPVLLGDWVPKGTFQAAIFGSTPTSSDPNECATFCSRNIPTEATNFRGSDVSRIASPAVDAAWDAVAKELDDRRRRDLVARAHEALADELPVLPVSPVLDIVVYNKAKVGGVRTSPVGAFSNLFEWYCRADRC